MATQARVAGTVKIDGVAAARDVIVIKDDPAGRAVVAVGQSAGDGTFDITYNDWAGAVIALALDEYGDEFSTETALNMGQVVHPITPNGYVYKVTDAGTTGTEEPTWPTTGSVQSGGVTFAAQPYYRPVASGPLQGVVVAISPYLAAVMESSPVAYWRLNDTQLPVMVAEVGDDGAFEGAPSLGVSGLTGDGTAVQLGDGDYLSTSNPLAGAGSTFTIEMVVSGIDGSATQNALAADGLSSSYGLIVGYSPGVVGVSEARIYHSGTNVDVSFPVTDGGTHHVAFVFDEGSPAENIRVFVDGIKVDSVTASLSVSHRSSLYFGSWRNTLEGIYDEIAIYHRALSDAEIADHYDASGIGQSQ